jgi:hypothetical protein
MSDRPEIERDFDLKKTSTFSFHSRTNAAKKPGAEVEISWRGYLLKLKGPAILVIALAVAIGSSNTSRQHDQASPNSPHQEHLNPEASDPLAVTDRDIELLSVPWVLDERRSSNLILSGQAAVGDVELLLHLPESRAQLRVVCPAEKGDVVGTVEVWADAAINLTIMNSAEEQRDPINGAVLTAATIDGTIEVIGDSLMTEGNCEARLSRGQLRFHATTNQLEIVTSQEVSYIFRRAGSTSDDSSLE